MADPITVWGTGTPRTLRVYWALEELSITYQSIVIRTRTEDMDRADFLAVSPGKKIPAIEHQQMKLSESGAIVSFLYAKFAGASGDTHFEAEVARWTHFTLMELDATALYVMRRHRDLPNIYGAAPAAVTCGAEYFDRQALVVSQALADGRQFVAGDVFSPADIHLNTCCAWALAYELTLPEILAEYHQRISARSAFKAALEANKPSGITPTVAN
ncbi:MAG: glutathione S-transferase family protein [Pseudomonadota bacterium]